MKKEIFVFVLFIAFVCTGNLFAKGNVEPDCQSLLWKISGNGLEKPSYLFGTIHMIPEDKFFLPKNTDVLISETDALVLEIDPNIPMKKQIEIAQKMILPAGKTYNDFLNEWAYADFRSYLIDSLEISEGKMERYMHLKPIYIAGPLLMEAYPDVEMYEKYFSKMAKKNKMELLTLESVDFQINLLDSMPLEIQFEDFSARQLFVEYEKLLEVYINQDLNGMLEIMEEYEQEDMLEKLFAIRNKNWAEKLEKEILPSQSVFIAVGAGHLPGANGVINLLKDKGYTVEPVN